MAAVVRLRHRQRAYRRLAADRHPVLLVIAAAAALLLVVGVVSLSASTAFGMLAYAYYGRDLPEPRAALEALDFTQQTQVYDRTGQVPLGRYGTDRRELALFEEIPEELIDATTAMEDDSFWDNPGFDMAGIGSAAIDTLNGFERGGSTITQQLVRDRLLPQSAFDGSIYERKVKEIIQAARLTEAYPGLAGKRAIMQTYLNNNNYGNRTYGVKAAARVYFGKQLGDLTLAECALLAAIPQWPARYDLVHNAIEESVGEGDTEAVRLVVPANAPVVLRRNRILDAMRTRSVLSGDRHQAADYERAKAEPVILAPQKAEPWRAPHFLWQVRQELSAILCGPDEQVCPAIDSGGYTVLTTLDYRMQRIVEKWVYAAAIIPNSKKPQTLLKDRKIPRSEWAWIRGLRGHNIHNAAAAVMDYRKGEVLAYAGSASYTAKKTRRFQPQFDVLADGWRQPGSAIKPIHYAIGIDARAMTAATMFMDVVTNFAPAGAKAWYPTQADHYERGPVRLRNALQMSLNIPAIKAGFVTGLKTQLKRSKDFGLVYPKGTAAVASMSIGTLETHPIDMISAYGAIANGGVLVKRHTILKIIDAHGQQVWPAPDAKTPRSRAVSRQAAYIITDILAGNTIRSVNPFWGKWRVTDGVTGSTVRPAAYKTGTTSDNRDVHAYGYLAPPADRNLPALVAGVWMGNSDNSPNDGRLSLDTSAPLWSAILSDVAKGMPIERFARTRPKGIVTASVDAFTGLRPGPTTVKVVKELFIAGTVPAKAARASTVVNIDAATGLRWREGCAGPMVTRAYVDFSRLEARFKRWEKADRLWQARASGGAGRSGGPKGTRTSYFYGGGFYPYGRTWGGGFPPAKECPVAPPPVACVPGDPASPCPSAPAPTPSPKPKAGG